MNIYMQYFKKSKWMQKSMIHKNKKFKYNISIQKKPKKPYTCILKLEGRIFQPVRRNLPSDAFQSFENI